jgi:predicted ATPase
MMEAQYDPAKAQAAADKFVAITGCSGGGKSSLLAELAARGYRTFPEPGRQIVKEQTPIGRPNIISDDPVLFGELCIARTLHRMIEAADGPGPMFFDRTHIDPLSHYAGRPAEEPAHWRRAAEAFRFHPTVFFVPPWPEIFEQDSERRHKFEDGLAEYPVLLRNYERFGYRPMIIPKAPVPVRADFVLRTLSHHT